jgi:hypothetical protein
MAGTFSRMYMQIVFAVQGRQNLLASPWRQEVFKYTSGIINAKGKNQLLSTALLTTSIVLSASGRRYQFRI